ncbi:fork head domain transcription factor slp1-like [Actinia tenebrosa]|uniref:Fork head domain transcription factor slp1-like n=1 Tax=Actinia tenebrosa TaxID=6105 RepID=A0A6P8H858_ACTTE|nr:fork head domain transcription factor slp1-like [Actinia tenebrosa]
MSHFLQLHKSGHEYRDYRLVNDQDTLGFFRSPGSERSVMSTKELASRKMDTKEERMCTPEELVRDEDENHGVVSSRNTKEHQEEEEEQEEEDMEKKRFIKEEETEKGNEKTDSKEDEKNQETFVAVIAQSILSLPTKRMTLSSIYSYIANNYPHFDKEKGPGWRNSVRHNLSSNDCFVKASRAENGKGHYWMIHPKDLPEFSKGNFRRRRKPRRPKCSHSMVFRDGPLYYHHTYGLGCSSYVYPGLRASQDLADIAYGTSSDRSLAHSYRARVPPGLLSPYEESPTRYALSSYPYTCPASNISIRGYPSETSLLRSPTAYSSLSNYTSSFHPVNQHYSTCACHRWQLDSPERHSLSS